MNLSHIFQYNRKKLADDTCSLYVYHKVSLVDDIERLEGEAIELEFPNNYGIKNEVNRSYNVNINRIIELKKIYNA